MTTGVPERITQTACASCGAPLSGSFCSACGEQVLDRHALTLWHFIAHGVLHELTHVDGKIFRTFRYLLFRPGFLSEEYFCGRRRSYVNPVRLLLTVVVLIALVGQPTSASLNLGRLRLSLMPPGPPSSGATISGTLKPLDVLGVLSRLADRAGRTRDVKSDAAVEKFHHELKTYGTALSVSNVVLLAGLLFALFHTRRRLFVEHLVFSLHLASFILLFGLATGWVVQFVIATRRTAPIAALAVVSLAFLLIQVVYVYRALLRFYVTDGRNQIRWWSKTAWLTRLAVLVVFLGNSVFITVVYAAGAAIALTRL